MTAIIARYGLAALFVGGGIEGETVVVVGGILAHRGLVSLPGAMAATAAGSFAADQIFFLIGRKASGWRLVQRLKRNPIYARALSLLERYPIGFIFAFRFIYGFRTISPFAIGTSGVSERLFLPCNAAAAIIWACTFTTLGYVFGKEVERFLGRYEPTPATIAIGVAVLVAAGVALHVGRRWWTARRG
jgi:membrane protein DedA with SNARE-associated domain